MPDRRLVAIVTGLMLVMGSLGGRAAEPTLEQLRSIDTLLSRNDTTGLWAFLQQHPELLTGDDALAVELRRFCTDVTVGRLSCHYETPLADTAAATDTPDGLTEDPFVARAFQDLPGIY